MVKNEINLQRFVVVLVIVLVVLGGFVFYESIDRTPKQTVDVRGEGEVSVNPDIVSVYLRAETNASSAKEARDENSKIVDNVIYGLVVGGIDRDSITTQSFNVYEDYDWTREGRVFRGYKATHTLKVELSSDNINLVGKVVDISIDNGALLQYINFEVSGEKQNEYEAEATLLATQNARMKAGAIAEGLEMNLGKVVSVSDTSFSGYFPYRAYGSEDMAIDVAGSEVERAVTNIQPGEQKIRANVNVVYGLR